VKKRVYPPEQAKQARPIPFSEQAASFRELLPVPSHTRSRAEEPPKETPVLRAL
jgi:hypothetical protein